MYSCISLGLKITQIRQAYSNAICLYRRISMVTILRKILNLPVVTKGFSWKDSSSRKNIKLINLNTNFLKDFFTTIDNLSFCKLIYDLFENISNTVIGSRYPVVTKGFSWKDSSSRNREILHVTFITIHKNN
jgi:hypothetical protein